MNEPQHSLNGIYIGDRVTFKSAGNDYTGKVLETDHLSAWIKVHVEGTSATVLVNDAAVTRLDDAGD